MPTRTPRRRSSGCPNRNAGLDNLWLDEGNDVRRAAVVITAAALVAVLAGCVPEATSTPTPTGSAVASAGTPTPTPTVHTVAGGDKPPTVFGGDCSAVLSAEQLATAIGADVVPEEVDPVGSDDHFSAVANAGGLSCGWADWDDSGVHIVVTIFPAAGLTGVDPRAVTSDWSSPNCAWYCAVVNDAGDLTVVTTMNGRSDSSSPREDTIRVGDLLTPQIADNHALTAAEPWERDRRQWRGVDDCEGLSSVASDVLGFDVQGENWSLYIDPPLHGWLIADEASWLWVCALRDANGARAEVWGYAGAAWGEFADAAYDDLAPADGLAAGWTGVSVTTSPLADATRGRGYIVSDGVNVIHTSPVPEGFGADASELIGAVIAAFEAQH
jgi:hypothetical protein